MGIGMKQMRLQFHHIFGSQLLVVVQTRDAAGSRELEKEGVGGGGEGRSGRRRRRRGR